MTDQTKEGWNIPDVSNKSIEFAEVAIFWNEIESFLPKSFEREALGDNAIFIAFRATYPKIRNYIIKQTEQRVAREILSSFNLAYTPEGIQGDVYVMVNVEDYERLKTHYNLND